MYTENFNCNPKQFDTLNIKNRDYFLNSKIENLFTKFYMMKVFKKQGDRKFRYFDMDDPNNRKFMKNPKTNCHPDFYIRDVEDSSWIRYFELKSIFLLDCELGGKIKMKNFLLDTDDFIEKYNNPGNVTTNEINYCFVIFDNPGFHPCKLRDIYFIKDTVFRTKYKEYFHLNDKGQFILDLDLFNNLKKERHPEIISRIQGMEYKDIYKTLNKEIYN